ncbi:phosphotransferase family protein [Arthrobacter sp. I2-34]|uniref:Phosphotransferase family protein n=1 Tax=Arthrobacter hankyongi TaxID=2904801 RepID=A0ABS9L3H3_9MICC|nr:phosphotransferase family protein [Arthrobacter hankyongi]MCG2621229.1 phosphotransferase family protein [Arthrobacter hankyongi]
MTRMAPSVETPVPLQGRIADFIGARVDGGAVEVSGLHRVGGGSSRENWPFDALWGNGGSRRSHALLLRRDPQDSVVSSDRDVEFNLLGALESTPVPAPRALWIDEAGNHFDRPSMILERCPGSAARSVLRDKDPLGLGLPGQVGLAQELCRLLVTVHRLDVGDAGLDGILQPPPNNPAEDQLRMWLAELDRQETAPEPQLRMAATWLGDNLPDPPERLVLVHGDFRPANVLVHEGRIEALLDWELARLGDPLDDLGWYTAPLYRQEHFIPGFWEASDFLACYEQLAGFAVEPAALKFWQVLATFRLAVIALTSVRSFREGTADRPTAPVTGIAAQALAAAIS